MKNRNLDHSNHWATPPLFYNPLNSIYHFDFDPCPYMHDVSEWDGLKVDWRRRNFVNPPYSRKEKESFVVKAIEESKKGHFCLMLLPVSTSTGLFHDLILPNMSEEIEFIKRRIPFIGMNTKGQWVNWNQWDRQTPFDGVHVKNSGMHDSMLVRFGVSDVVDLDCVVKDINCQLKFIDRDRYLNNKAA